MQKHLEKEKLMDSQTKLSILIPTLESRSEMLLDLVDNLLDQADELGVTNQLEIIPLQGTETIGEKRNMLLEMAEGDYICFFDDDDIPSDTYIKRIFEGIAMGKDCISLRGVITFDGKSPAIFEHSIKYTAYKETDNDVKYERYPNHLNAIKASIAKQFKFPKINHGEDTDWATQIHRSGLIKSEHFVDEVIYHYNYVSTK